MPASHPLALLLIAACALMACDCGSAAPQVDADPPSVAASEPPAKSDPLSPDPQPGAAVAQDPGAAPPTGAPRPGADAPTGEPRPRADAPTGDPGPVADALTDAPPGADAPTEPGDTAAEQSSAEADDNAGLSDDAPPENNTADADANTDDDDATNTDPDDPDRQVWITHVVVPRETIELLALRYRSDPGKIRSWNKMASGAQARPRKKLRILARKTPPPRELRRHLVTEDDTWGRIGHRYGVDPTDLRAVNMHRTGKRLDPGEEVDVWLDPTIYAAIQADAPPPGPAAAVSPGAYAVGRPHNGRLVNGTRIPESDDYELRYPGSSWGTTTSVRALVTAIRSWRESTGYGGRLAIGSMSRERGRPIGGHLSHQAGRDVDIRLPLYETLPQTRTPLGRRVDWWVLWQLIVALEETGHLSRIFLDYKLQKRLYKAAKEHGVSKEDRRRIIQFPRGPGSGRGLVRHSPGHDRHFHARFRCADYEVECAGS